MNWLKRGNRLYLYLARWIDHAPVAQSLDGGFEDDAQETRGLWIQPLPIQILSDRHVENSSPPKATIWFLQGTLVGRVSYQKTQKTGVFFLAGGNRTSRW